VALAAEKPKSPRAHRAPRRAGPDRGRTRRRRIQSCEGGIGRLDRQRTSDRLRRRRQDVPDRHVLAKDLLQARRRAHAGQVGWVRYAEIVAGPADRVEDGVIGRQEAELVGPTMVVRAAVRVLVGDLQVVRTLLVAWRTLVGAVLADEETALQRVVVWREADRVAVPISHEKG